MWMKKFGARICSNSKLTIEITKITDLIVNHNVKE
jgi:hypothetical protein